MTVEEASAPWLKEPPPKKGAPSPAAEQWGKTPVAECSHSVWRHDGSCMYCGLSAPRMFELLKEVHGSGQLERGIWLNVDEMMVSDYEFAQVLGGRP